MKDIEIAEGAKKLLASAGQGADALTIQQTITSGLAAGSTAGHQWPPIISLSEANGHYFKSGSAELSQGFREELQTTTPQKIAELIEQYDVDVIEVVGHTDEQPIAARPSNLDVALVSVLRNEASVGSLVPSDNAGLGLARAVSVVSVLRQSKLLEPYKLVPLSGAQLVNTDETLAVGGSPGAIPERRRIEIRLRKSNPSDAITASIPVENIPLPRPKPILSALKPHVLSHTQLAPNAPLLISHPQ